jgi:flagellar hook assembly protein FlgD
VKATFTLSRPASVTLQVETNLGTVVEQTQPQTLSAGAQSVTWDGNATGGAPAPAGSYVLRVVATSSVGTMDLAAPVSLRR